MNHSYTDSTLLEWVFAQPTLIAAKWVAGQVVGWHQRLVFCLVGGKSFLAQIHLTPVRCWMSGPLVVGAKHASDSLELCPIPEDPEDWCALFLMNLGLVTSASGTLFSSSSLINKINRKRNIRGLQFFTIIRDFISPILYLSPCYHYQDLMMYIIYLTLIISNRKLKTWAITNYFRSCFIAV